MKDIFVIVAENDQPFNLSTGKKVFDDSGPIVFERYTRNADYATTVKDRASLGGRYGRCRIARLVFVDEEPKKKKETQNGKE